MVRVRRSLPLGIDHAKHAPATTVDEIVTGLAAQASRDAAAPVDVTVGGYTGTQITLHVPNDAEAIADCDFE